MAVHPAQRLWVTFSIYLSVVGWAYAIGSLLTLVQDRSFRHALALRRFTRKVARLREPFLLMVGYGRAGELLAKAFDALGQQLVVIDESPTGSTPSIWGPITRTFLAWWPTPPIRTT